MTKQEKQLLLIDLCARLPYGVKANIPLVDGDERIYTVSFDDMKDFVKGYINIKPYLRPMSSMTNEEREHLQTLHDIISDENYGDGFSPAAWEAILDFNNYCREHHLDNGGLITLGLALEAPDGMYK